MKYEVEQKFYSKDLEMVRQALADLGATSAEPEFQSDIYLGHPSRDFAKTDEALRLRHNGVETFITYKGPRVDSVTKTRTELELPLPSGNDFRVRFAELLRALGFRDVVEIRKRRRATSIFWEGTTIEVVLDEVEGLGTFVELEAMAGESELDQRRRQIASLARRLGLTENERRSYCELILNR